MEPRLRRSLGICAGVAWVALSAYVWWWGIQTVRHLLAVSDPYSPERVELAIASTCTGEVDGTVPAVRVEPAYPITALDQEIEGWVEVEYRVLRDGSVSEARLLAAEPEMLGEEGDVVQAVLQWVHCPNDELPEEGVLRTAHFDFSFEEE